MSKLWINAFALLAVMLLSNVLSATEYPADNTGKNVRDRGDATLTPEDQSEKKADRRLTQQVRKVLQDDESLSMNAKNVKVITVGGKITLRGPVNSEGEKLKVCEKARQIAGVENVNDQLEIVSKH